MWVSARGAAVDISRRSQRKLNLKQPSDQNPARQLGYIDNRVCFRLINYSQTRHQYLKKDRMASAKCHGSFRAHSCQCQPSSCNGPAFQRKEPGKMAVMPPWFSHNSSGPLFRGPYCAPPPVLTAAHCSGTAHTAATCHAWETHKGGIAQVPLKTGTCW